MPLLSTLYFVGTAMFDYFEVNLWLALYGVCIEAKQVIIKNKIKCCKNTNHGVGLLDLRLTFSPLVTGHFSCSEWDHSHVCHCVSPLFVLGGKKWWLVFFLFFFNVLLKVWTDKAFYTNRWPWPFSFIASMLNCVNFFNDFFPPLGFAGHMRKSPFTEGNLH